MRCPRREARQEGPAVVAALDERVNGVAVELDVVGSVDRKRVVGLCVDWCGLRGHAVSRQESLLKCYLAGEVGSKRVHIVSRARQSRRLNRRGRRGRRGAQRKTTSFPL